ncbi:MAG: hypothetical protein QM778_01190 [Myxococcales bacterium]
MQTSSRSLTPTLLASLGACFIACGGDAVNPLGPLESTESEVTVDGDDAAVEPSQAAHDAGGHVPSPIDEPVEDGADAATTMAPSTSAPGASGPAPASPKPIDVSDDFDVADVCTSGRFWTRGYSETMHPGHACISCHSMNVSRPQFKIAGTVYPTAHEPNDCDAANPADVRVEIIGANGQVSALSANEVGNFFSLNAVALPYTARVTSQGRVRAMRSPQRSGDCNACHTQRGDNGAPGRILLP